MVRCISPYIIGLYRLAIDFYGCAIIFLQFEYDVASPVVAEGQKEIVGFCEQQYDNGSTLLVYERYTTSLQACPHCTCYCYLYTIPVML